MHTSRTRTKVIQGFWTRQPINRHIARSQLHKFRRNRSIGRRVMAFPIFSNMAAVRHLEFQFCHSGPPAKSTMRFNYPVKIWGRSDFAVEDIEILWLCQFGWKMPYWSFWTFELIKIAGRHKNRQKAHPRTTTHHLCHKQLKSVQRCDLGAVARKSITRTGQDRTTKSDKSVIFHIFGGKFP